MSEITLVIGGCRSGKSGHALKLAEELAVAEGRQRIFIATCQPMDEEMRRRVAAHQAERPEGWRVIEAPEAVPEAVAENAGPGRVALVDCLTLWISNLLLKTDDPEAHAAPARRLIDALKAARGPVILVTNELGCGVVPDNRLARMYRDMVGHVNAAVAAAADRVIWTVAGIPVTIKAPPTGEGAAAMAKPAAEARPSAGERGKCASCAI